MKSEHLAGEESVWINVSSEPLDAAAVLSFVEDPASGCSILFTGTVRNHSPGRDEVTVLEYEAYAGVVEDKIAGIASEAIAKWSVNRVAAVHRVGRLTVGEPAVMVAVSAAHRAECFPAARFVIDELKSRVPIWKKEHWAGGAEWVDESS